MGLGDDVAADQGAVEAMRQAFNAIAIDGTVVIGEGPEDAMPMLYTGERVGVGQGPKTDVALDALEGASSCAIGGWKPPARIRTCRPRSFPRVPGPRLDKTA